MSVGTDRNRRSPWRLVPYRPIPHDRGPHASGEPPDPGFLAGLIGNRNEDLDIEYKAWMDLPIPVVSTVGARSNESASLQLCDLVAGLVSRASAPDQPPEFREFLGAVIDAGFGEVTVFPVDAGTDFVSGPPERATGPDIVDRIAQAVRSRRKGQGHVGS